MMIRSKKIRLILSIHLTTCLITLLVTSRQKNMIYNYFITKYSNIGEEEPLWNITSAHCVDQLASGYNRVEDIFCTTLPQFLPQYKNPCFNQHQETMKPVLKCLPYFYIIGMDKCGTTDLHSRLLTHPHMRANGGILQKETNYWPWSRYGMFHNRKVNEKSYLQKYTDFFEGTAKELETLPKDDAAKIITGDATPMIMWDFRFWKMIPQNYGLEAPEILTPHLLKYIHKGISPKFLIQFREPVERLYSDYVFLEHGNNSNTFHSHVKKAISIMEECIKHNGTRLCFFDDKIYRSLPTRIHLGCYSVYIKEWFRVFPRSAFHITRTEDFTSDVQDHLSDMFNFLGLDPLSKSKLDITAAKDRRHVTRNKKGTILPSTIALLKKFYRPYLEETAILLGDDRFLWEDVYAKITQTQQTDAVPSQTTPPTEGTTVNTINVIQK